MSEKVSGKESQTAEEFISKVVRSDGELLAFNAADYFLRIKAENKNYESEN